MGAGQMLITLLNELREHYPHGDVNVLEVVAQELFEDEPDYRVRAVADKATEMYFDMLMDAA